MMIESEPTTINKVIDALGRRIVALAGTTLESRRKGSSHGRSQLFALNLGSKRPVDLDFNVYLTDGQPHSLFARLTEYVDGEQIVSSSSLVAPAEDADDPTETASSNVGEATSDLDTVAAHIAACLCFAENQLGTSGGETAPSAQSLLRR